MQPDELKRWQDTVAGFLCLVVIFIPVFAYAIRWAIQLFKGEEE